MTNSPNIADVLGKATRAVRDGYSASMASIVSVFLLMWIRTTMSYQFVNDVSMSEAMALLYAEGGIARFYKGIIPALIMMPLSRFGDIFANEVSREFLSDRLSTGLVTAVASSLAALWRILISPADTIKTTMQVHGSKAIPLLHNKIRKMGIGALYEGSLGSAAATWVGHYPWFVTHNFLEALCVRRQILDAHLTKAKGLRRHVRRALVGLCSSLVSDVCSNAIRVLKTFKQTSADPIGYAEAASRIISESGIQGIFFRGLSTKLFANALNAMLFTVVWKAISETVSQRQQKKAKSEDHVPLLEPSNKNKPE
mmetsp:Transcript_36763/g.54006  ORF Transcript_36763/g.54006 Transcript_36763/m.54006 type:complete len:312 (-) Transcript_36763:228-1163(-)|eukprot:CAMPEP_0195517850 /NCGR_PEP_ID=MMETSP0794_2-20130614/11785_1 /TAXON_ID=515487 /ORGANISM="Stephanopyxis turris, Strain CCMP 815" /LENGTH=311 /DNA_ID=CAMNT_0040646725 /DNA_START=28 /DNA_END=963 /DNA_ORIENTATION=-